MPGGIKLTLGVPVAECRVTHVRKLDVAFRTGIHEHVALCWMKLGGSDDLRQLLHIDGFDVHDIWR